MVVLIWFVVTDDSEYDEGHTNTGVDNDGTSSVHDGYGKPFVIVSVTKIAYHIQEIATVLVKKDYRWSVYDDLCKSFLMLLCYRNCV